MKPTELTRQADTLRVVAALTHTAILAGATVVPSWYMPIDTMTADGALRSEDDSAIRDFDRWMTVLGGTASIKTYTYVERNAIRRAWAMETNYQGVSFHLIAIVPVTVETRPAAAPSPLLVAMEVAA